MFRPVLLALAPAIRSITCISVKETLSHLLSRDAPIFLRSVDAPVTSAYFDNKLVAPQRQYKHVIVILASRPNNQTGRQTNRQTRQSKAKQSKAKQSKAKQPQPANQTNNQSKQIKTSQPACQQANKQTNNTRTRKPAQTNQQRTHASKPASQPASRQANIQTSKQKQTSTQRQTHAPTQHQPALTSTTHANFNNPR